jgi:hypothetical protein
MTFKIIRPQTIAETTEFSRADPATYYDEDGVLQTAAIDVPRFTYDPSNLTLAPTLLLEDAATNQIRNNTMAGVVAGTPGTLPTNWGGGTVPNGITRSVVGSGVEDGIEYVDIRWNGVAAATVLGQEILRTEGNTIIAAALGQAWAGSAFCYIVAGSLANVTFFGADIVENNIAGAGLVAGPTVSITATAGPLSTRRTLTTRTTTNASVSYVNQRLIWNLTIGAVVDFTVRIGLPQLELGLTASSAIKTSTIAVTRAADIPGDMLTSSVPEDDYPEYDAGTAYGLGDFVISTTTHRIYESLQAANTGNPLPVMPEISTAWWLNVSATNRWKMFDNSITSQTEADDIIAVTIATVGRVDSVSLLNASAQEVRIIMEDETEGVVYDQTYSLIDDSGVTDYYEYFFEPVTSIPNFSVEDLPLYANSLVSIIVTNPGGSVLIGAAVVGLSRTFGQTELGASLGIEDYSVKITDDFGNKTILERAFNDLMEVQVYVESANVDFIKKLLAEYRAQAVVYKASDTYGSMILYGFFRDFRFVISYPTYSVLTIELEGLT